ncbi:MAG: hypothetical protein P8J32_01590 [bacterium]|nr:hypothetical protein [bacterium]
MRFKTNISFALTHKGINRNHLLKASEGFHCRMQESPLESTVFYVGLSLVATRGYRLETNEGEMRVLEC